MTRAIIGKDHRGLALSMLGRLANRINETTRRRRGGGIFSLPTRPTVGKQLTRGSPTATCAPSPFICRPEVSSREHPERRLPSDCAAEPLGVARLGVSNDVRALVVAPNGDLMPARVTPRC